MSVEEHPSIERVSYECRLYGDDVYYEFKQYCFWRTVVRTEYVYWSAWVPAYFLEPPAGPEGEGA